MNLYRAMRAERDGRPSCGPTARSLGVRVPGDLRPDAAGKVAPKTGGMSVTSPDPHDLPSHRRPPAWGGIGRDPIFVIAVAALPGRLAARPEAPSSSHWFIEPATVMSCDELQATLCATRHDWQGVTPP